MNPRLARLQPYPFERLRALIAQCTPPPDLAPISLSIGEPRHQPPPFIAAALTAALDSLDRYPATLGEPALRSAAARWLERRFALGEGRVDPERMVLPVAGTREALFAIAQAVIDTSGPRAPYVAMPNPGYQIYEGAALLAGAEPFRLDTTPASGYKPELRAVAPAVWERCQLLYLCSPGNPTGAVLSLDELKAAIELAHRYDFVIASDECYADVYLDEQAPPPGCLAAAQALGLADYERVIVFHSLSKRSSVPGLRSGFVAGDPRLLERFRLYRTYHGCALPHYVQAASALAWEDDAHAHANRALYAAKFDAVLPILAPVLAIERPPAAFYLWPAVNGDDEAFVRGLYASQNVLALPGRYLARDGAHGNPGAGRVRLSLVAPLADCVSAAHRIRSYLKDPH